LAGTLIKVDGSRGIGRDPFAMFVHHAKVVTGERIAGFASPTIQP